MAARLFIEGRDAGTLADTARTAIRRDTIGFVYQFHHLLGEFTALENVVLPQMIAGRSRRAATDRRMALLSAFGLGAARGPFTRETVGRRATTGRHRTRLGQRAEGVAGR